MVLMTFLRRLLKKGQSGRSVEYIKETSLQPSWETAATAIPPPEAPPAMPVVATEEEEIAFSPQGDLEAYVRGLAVSKEAIERWISAGVLLPEETKVAAKMIRIMCKHEQRKIH